VTRQRSLWLDREPPSEAEGGPFSTARWNRQAAEARELRAVPTEEPPPPEPPRRSRRRVVLGVVALGTAVAALGFSLAAFLGDDSGSEVVGADGGRPLPDTQIGRVYDAAGPAVVSVQAGPASGTGFVVDGDGTIVTNAHVVSTATSAQVRFNDTGRLLEAEVLGTDPSSDLAVLRVDPGSAGRLRSLRFANSERVEVGDAVVAIGHPFGLDRTATAGIVSGVGRSIEAPDGFQIDDAIQTDAPINPGNSGGPLLDARGRVVGVNSQIATAGGGGNVGIGFAVPANAVREVLPRLSRGESIERPYLGVTTSLAPGGAEIQAIQPGGPAAGADLRAGDVIVAIDGESVRDPDDVSEAVSEREPGDEIEVEVLRDGERRTIRVELAKRPGP
jgi:putative serine protease PepD